MTYLGIDYGTSHIGIALAAGPLAEPLDTISAKSVLTRLPLILKKHHVDEIVIGESTAEFLGKLASFGLPVNQVDETLTTIDAQKALFHTSPSRRKEKEHAVSAAIILQSYLDSHPRA